MLSKLTIPAALLTIMVCFAANSVITRYLVLGNHLSPFILTAIRFLSGFLMLQILVFLNPTIFQKTKLDKSYILGGIFLGIYAFSISYGYLFISAAAGTLIFYFFVVLTMSLFSIIKDKEKPTIHLILGQILGIVGVLIVTYGGIKSVTSTGVLLITITGVSWGLHSVLGRKFNFPFAYTYNSFLILGLIILVLTFFLFTFAKSNFRVKSLNAFSWAIFMGMISTALSYTLWHRVVKKIKASQAGVTQLLVPVLTVLMGSLFLEEKVGFSLILGGTLILAGIFLNTFK